MSDPLKDGREKSILTEAAASFIASESNGLSMITVTNILLEDNGKTANILVSVLPDAEAEKAVEFLKRKRGVFRDYLKSKTRLARIPFIDFNLDLGEKNRQRVEELTQPKA